MNNNEQELPAATRKLIADQKAAIVELSAQNATNYEIARRATSTSLVPAVVVSVSTYGLTIEEFEVGQEVQVCRGEHSGLNGIVQAVRPEDGEVDILSITGVERTVCVVQNQDEFPPVFGPDGDPIEEPTYWDYHPGRIFQLTPEDEVQYLIVSNPDQTGHFFYTEIPQFDEDGVLLNGGIAQAFYLGRYSAVCPVGTPFGSVEIRVAGEIRIAELPKEFDVNPGDQVLINDKDQIISAGGKLIPGESAKVEGYIQLGNLYKVTTVQRSFYVTPLAGDSYEVGDEVVLDSYEQFIVCKGLEVKKTVPDSFVRVHAEDIAGQDFAVDMIERKIFWPHKHKDLYEKHGKLPPKGFLLKGPPGCGKTMLGKYLATRLVEEHEGRGADTAFQSIGPTEFLTMWVGETERKIREMFGKAKKHFEEHGYPQVIFLDEIEQMFRKRGSSNWSSIQDNVITTFLNEMDGIETSYAILIGTTNRPDILDPAVIRPGRLDCTVEIARPDLAAAQSILWIYLQKSHLGDVTDEELTEMMTNTLNLLETIPTKSEKSLWEERSGALLMQIVEDAKELAIEEAIKSQADVPLRWRHLETAIQNRAEQDNSQSYIEDKEEVPV